MHNCRTFTLCEHCEARSNRQRGFGIPCTAIETLEKDRNFLQVHCSHVQDQSVPLTHAWFRRSNWCAWPCSTDMEITCSSVEMCATNTHTALFMTINMCVGWGLRRLLALRLCFLASEPVGPISAPICTPRSPVRPWCRLELAPGHTTTHRDAHTCTGHRSTLYNNRRRALVHRQWQQRAALTWTGFAAQKCLQECIRPK